MRRLFFVTATLFVSMVSFAGKVTEKQAFQKAQYFMQGKQFKHRNLRRAPSNGSNAYYVFNAENNDGFVIVSGDDRTTPVLGYGNTGNLVMENLPDNLKWWLESYAAQIAALGDEQEAAASTILGPAIEPLVQSKWAQDLPYNSMCPDGNYIDYDEAGFDRYDRCVGGDKGQVPLSPWCMDGYGTKLHKTIMKYRYLIILALTALCFVGCGNGTRNAELEWVTRLNEKSSYMRGDTLIDTYFKYNQIINGYEVTGRWRPFNKECEIGQYLTGNS